MSVNGVVYQVAIASPSDVREEPKVIRDVVHDWNSAHSRTRKAILLPVGWETDVAPLMGGNAQDHIDGQMVKDSDLLIAVFWTRLERERVMRRVGRRKKSRNSWRPANQ